MNDFGTIMERYQEIKRRMIECADILSNFSCFYMVCSISTFRFSYTEEQDNFSVSLNLLDGIRIHGIDF